MPTKTIRINCTGAELLPIDFLSELQGGLKELKPENEKKLRKNILELGFSEPVTIWKKGEKYYIVNGHQRVKVLAKMAEEGYEIPKIPANIVDAKDEVEAKKLVLSLTSQFGTMTKESLLSFAGEAGLTLKDIDESFSFPEVDTSELRLPDEDDPGKDDAIPEPAPEPVAKRGDIYQLGDHRLMCGDAASEKDLDELTEGKKSEMIFTDPPYGVDYSGGMQFKAGKTIRDSRKRMQNDSHNIIGRVIPLMAKRCGGPAYVWFGGTKGRGIYNAVDGCGEIRAVIIWMKRGGYAGMMAHYKQKHEMCLYWKPQGASLRWCGQTTESTIWETAKDGINTYHPTQKPVALAARAIANHKIVSVLDPFGGSGSTLIACEKLGRRCRAMEIDPIYIDVIIKRWEEYTGKRAEKLTTKTAER